MDLTFLIIVFIVMVIILFIFNRIVWKSTIWSSFVAALWWALITILLIKTVVPVSYHDNSFGVMGIFIIIFIVLVVATVYITERSINDVDLRALSVTDRNIVLW